MAACGIPGLVRIHRGRQALREYLACHPGDYSEAAAAISAKSA